MTFKNPNKSDKFKSKDNLRLKNKLNTSKMFLERRILNTIYAQIRFKRTNL